jgi:sugar phosphate isomerase/epimerase
MERYMKYFISTCNFSTDARKKITDTVYDMVDEGVKHIEISSLHPFEDHIEDKLVAVAKEYNAQILLHNFAPPAKEGFLLNLCDHEPIFRKRAREFIKERIVLTKKLGMDYYSFHAGFRVNYKQGIHEYDARMSSKEAMDIFISELRELMRFAEEQKVHIGIENHVTISENIHNLILYEKKDFHRLFDEIPSKFLHLHLDLGHLKISAAENNFDRNEFLRLFGDKVMGMHVHDNTGIKVDCHAPFNPDDFWFGKKQFTYLKNLRYCIFETKTYGNKKLLTSMKRYFDEIRR